MRQLNGQKPVMQRSGQKGSTHQGREAGRIGGSAAGRGKPRAVPEHNLVGDEVMGWWELLTGGFVVTKRSLGGLKYDEEHLAFHLASKLCWLVVSIRASWGSGRGWTSLRKFGGVSSHSHHGEWKGLSTYSGQSPALSPSPPDHTSLLV